MVHQPIIGMVTPRYAPAIGGIEKCVEVLTQGLVKRGVTVEIITTDPTGQLPPVETLDGVLVRRFPTMFNNDVYYVSPQLGNWLSKNITRYTLIHAHSYHTPLALQAARICAQHNLPLIVTPHYHGTGHTRFRQLLHIPYRVPGKWMINQAQQIICVSQAEHDILTGHFGADLPTIVIPNGIDFAPIIDAEPFDKKANSRVILTAGRMEFYKQASRLIEAVPYLPNNYEVVVAGDGPAFEHAQKLIKELDIEDRVTLPGYLPRHELLSWFKTADVFVSMSRKEAFGITVLEGAVGGAAVIASDIPAHREIKTYLPQHPFFTVDTDISADELAASIQNAADSKTDVDIDLGKLPGWDSMVDEVRYCYSTIQSGQSQVAV